MTRRTWLAVVTVALTLAAGSAWAGWSLATARTAPKTIDCCLDPTCPPGCSSECPPDCLEVNAKAKDGTRVQQDEPSAETCCPSCARCP